MRRPSSILVRFITALTWLAWSAPLAGSGSGDITLQRLTERLYLVKGAGGNIACLVTDQGLLLVDSGNENSQAEAIRAAIRSISDKPVKYVVFTHHHGDHISGAAGFPGSPVIIAHDRIREKIGLERTIVIPLLEKDIRDLEKKAGELKSGQASELEKVNQQISTRIRQIEKLKRQKYTIPDITFDTALTLLLGGETIRLLYWGPGHTDNDILVHFPGEKAIHMGDLLFNNNWAPRLDGDAGASVENWLKIYDRVGEMDLESIIPGHGQVTGKQGYSETVQVRKQYLSDLKTAVENLIIQGSGLEEIKAKLKLPGYQHMEGATLFLPWNIEAAFREITARVNKSNPQGEK